MTPAGIALGTRTLARLPSWTVVDRFAQAWGTSGALPPPIGPVRVLVDRHLVDDERHVVDPPLELEIRRSLSHAFVVTMRATSPRSGARLRLPAGRYQVRFTSPLYQERVLDADLSDGAHPEPVALDPSPAYPFPPSAFGASPAGPTVLRGVLRGADGASVVGATVAVVDPTTWTFARSITDAAGEWMVLAIADDAGIALPEPDGAAPAHPVRLAITPAGAPSIEVTVEAIRGQDRRCPVLLRPSLRGRVVQSSGAPLPDARIEIAGRAESTRTDTDGSWWIEFPAGDAPGDVTLAISRQAQRIEIAQHVADDVTTHVPTIHFPKP